MASFVYKGVPRPAIDRAALRTIRQEEQRIYWQAYYKKNKDALRTQRKMRIWKTGE